MTSRAEKRRIIVIVGPTASGKTSLAIAAAKKFGGEIISADSRQIYRGMTIGTAKPTRGELQATPHHLIDIKNPNEGYTVAEYKKDALAAINDVLHREKLPILAGGTGLYVTSVLQNLHIPEVKTDLGLRAKLEREIKNDGLNAVFKKLVALDPEAAYIVDPKNPRRVIRALEVAIVTGVPFTAQRNKNAPLFDALEVGINLPPETLRSRIEQRIKQMIDDGLIQEVEQLVARYGAKQVAFDAIGYREVIDYLTRKTDIEKVLEIMKRNTWQYARRQMTWFRKDKAICWVKNFAEAEPIIEKFLR